MDGFFARGGAVALLTMGAALPLSAQGSGASTGPVHRDTVVRVIVGPRVTMDSLRVLMRAIDQEAPLSDQALRLRQEFEAAMKAMSTLGPYQGTTRIFFGRKPDGPPPSLEMHTRGYIGITTGDAPMKRRIDSSGFYVQYFAHPAIVSVDRDSPAQVAGILAGDSLVAYDGVDVVGRMLNLNQMLLPERRLGVTVRRAGENRDYQLTVARAPMMLFLREIDGDDPLLPGERVERVERAQGGGGRARVGGGRGTMPTVVGGQWIGEPGMRGGFTISNNGLFGASMETLEPGLAKAIDRPPGVLVKRVGEATVAGKAGLMVGDVIVAVGGQPITTLGEVQVASSRAENRTVTFQVVRDKKPRTITIVWATPASP